MPAELMTSLKLRPILSGWGNSQLQAALTLVAPPQKCPISPQDIRANPPVLQTPLEHTSHTQWAFGSPPTVHHLILLHAALPTPRHSRGSE